jgi:hypothetical protein
MKPAKDNALIANAANDKQGRHTRFFHQSKSFFSSEKILKLISII